MFWNDSIEVLQTSEDATYHLYSPASAESLLTLTELFHIAIPDEMKHLYLRTDGIGMALTELSEIGIIGYLVFPIEKMIEHNQMLRRHSDKYTHFLRHYLFIADAGNGDYFGYQIEEQEIRTTDIFVWNHENNTLKWIAGSIKDFITGWTTGSIKI